MQGATLMTQNPRLTISLEPDSYDKLLVLAAYEAETASEIVQNLVDGHIREKEKEPKVKRFLEAGVRNRQNKREDKKGRSEI
jgi:hypothetical protein